MHKVQLLGTGGGDWPDTVPTEEEYPDNRTYRRLCTALIDDNILIDFGPTLMSSIKMFNVDPSKITDVLLTHSHWDHFNPDALRALVAERPDLPALRVWGHPVALDLLPDIEGIVRQATDFGETITVGDWQVEPMRANHWVMETMEQPLTYLFTSNDIQWYYGTDGSWIMTPTWRRLSEAQLNMIIIDASYGTHPVVTQAQFGHNTIPMVRMIIEAMRYSDILLPDAQVILTHFSRYEQASHEELEKVLTPEGYMPAYDGMVISFAPSN